MIGLDIAKSVFQVHAVNERGKVEIKRKLQMSELLPFFEKQEACVVTLGSLWGRTPLGPDADRTGAQREADRAGSGAAIREEGELHIGS